MKQSTPKTWADLISVRSRYRRSVHLERDTARDDWLEGYVVTPLVRRVLRRIADGLVARDTARAWSLTGPYGSGKSAFALFLTGLLRVPKTPKGAGARALLKQADPQLWASLFGKSGTIAEAGGLHPIVITGERAPLDEALLRALLASAAGFWSRRPPQVLSKIRDAHAKLLEGRPINTHIIVTLVEEYARKVQESATSGQGILIIVDEAGKFLEFASQHPTRGDIHLFQELAEAANRSGDTPIVFVTLLHQAFERYAGRVGVAQRNDWAKVQGRFEDIAFLESLDQVVRLIGTAIEKPRLPAKIVTDTRVIAQDLESCTAALAHSDEDVASLLSTCAPLHPVTALLLGPLFRSGLSQNERSLFAFLGSTEPGAFQSFLGEARSGPIEDWPLYGIDRLYDYVATAWGARLYGVVGRRWAQVDEALRRLPESSGDLEARIVKTIGLLNVVSSATGLSASDDLIRSAVGVGRGTSERQYLLAMKRLVQASLVVFRKYRAAYQLWEGSDLNIDDLIRSAYQKADLQRTLIPRLERLVPPQPLVAKRHLFTTGTIRYFSISYCDESQIDEGLSTRRGEEDGLVWLMLPTSERIAGEVRQRLTEAFMWLKVGPSDIPVLVCMPDDAEVIRDAAYEVGAIEWVLSQTQQLHSDPIARRELEGRLADAESQLRMLLLGLWSGEATTQWYGRNGRIDGLRSGRSISAFLSELCDHAYEHAPYIHSELLNRRQLSTPAAGARRNLAEAIVERGDQKNLGFEGNPPELAMYRSILQAHSLHVETSAGWCFVPPANAQRGGLQQVWAAIYSKLEGSERKRRSLADLYDTLSAPPYGVKQGVLPLLVLVCLVQLADEVAVYEDDRFIPRLSGPIVERMLRSPKRFEVQRFHVDGPRADLFARLAHLLLGKGERKGRQIVPIVRSLVSRVSTLSEYARRTKQVSPHAAAIREVLLRAQEPHTLLVRDLPRACGFDGLESSRAVRREDVAAFVERLRDALAELESADASLRSRLSERLGQAFDVRGDANRLRTELSHRAARVEAIVVEPSVRTLVGRLRDTSLSADDWLVSLATLLSGKPPTTWHDVDIDRFEAALGVAAKKFATFEALTFGADSPSHADVDALLLRVSVARPGLVERARVVTVSSPDAARVGRCREALAEMVRGHRSELGHVELLAALSLAIEDLLDEDAAEHTSEERGTQS